MQLSQPRVEPFPMESDGTLPERGITVTRAPDDLYAAVYSDPITVFLPVRPKDNLRICYQKYL